MAHGVLVLPPQISVGTVRKSGDTASTDLAFGFRMILAGPEPYAHQEFRNEIAHLLDRCLTAAQGVDTSLVVLDRRTGVRVAPVRDSTRPERILPPTEGTRVAQARPHVIARPNILAARQPSMAVHAENRRLRA